MCRVKEEILSKIANAVLEMEEEETLSLSKKAIEEGIDPYEIIEQGLSKGMEEAGRLFEEEEYFVPELLICADAMNIGIDYVKTFIKAEETDNKKKVVIGVVQGDTHDIGKNLVKIMLSNAGFEVIDLGRDTLVDTFVSKAKEENADIICMSTLMTTTMENMKEVINRLNEEGIRNKFKIMIGGGPISSAFAKEIGADGYSANATEAVRLAKELVNI